MTGRGPGAQDKCREPLAHLAGHPVSLGISGLLLLLATAHPASAWTDRAGCIAAAVFLLVLAGGTVRLFSPRTRPG